MSDAISSSRPQDAPPEHEFSETNKDSFRSLAQSMSFVGVSMLLLSGLGGSIFGLVAFSEGFVPAGVAVLVLSGVSTLVGWWTMSAGRVLGGLVRTHGRDVQRLMEAVAQLRLLFGFARVVIILSTLLAILVAAAVVWCTLIGPAGGKCFGAFG